MKSVESLLKSFAGYIYLGMYDDAHNELESLPQEAKTHHLVLQARLILLIDLKKWEDAANLGQSLCKLWPEKLEVYFKTAHCLHALQKTQAAKDLLIDAPHAIRETALYFYILACYETQLGHHDQAFELLKT